MFVQTKRPVCLRYITGDTCKLVQLHYEKLTDLERNGEHQHGEDERPERPVPEHLQRKVRKNRISGLIYQTPKSPCIRGLVKRNLKVHLRAQEMEGRDTLTLYISYS